jgi:hypothetical protein
MGSITRTIANNLTNDLGGAGGINFRNIIINGDMSIAQRTTSAVTINSGTIQYGIDRFGARGMSSAGVFTIEQSTDAPTNFVNSFKATVTTADSSIASNATYRVVQHIEGNMIRNLNWGTSQAQDVTLSFKVKSSLTGTFGGAIINGDYNRFYNFSYTISSANTWTDVSVTIDGDTSGTWQTNNILGMRLSLSLGAGSGEVGSAGSWGTATYEGVTGQTNLIATNGATWQITGVQLEAGTSASDFEFLPVDVNLQRCQRYYQKFDDTSGPSAIYAGRSYGTTDIQWCVPLNCPLRASPSVSLTGTLRAFHGSGYNDSTSSMGVNHFVANQNLISLNSTGFTSIVDNRIYTVAHINNTIIELSSEL